MAKKKLNKKIAAAVVTTVILVGGGGFMAKQLYSGSYRPAQHKAEGRQLMLKGDYEAAYNRFGRAASRLSTDLEFLGWMYETALRRTSFSDTAFREARTILETMLAAQPSHVPTLISKLKFDLDILDAGGVEQFGGEQAKRMADQAKLVLASEPDNAIAQRAEATTIAIPVFKSDTTQTSVDIDAVAGELRTRLDKQPTNPDILTLYVLANARLREVLLRERAIGDKPDDPRTKEILADLEARLDVMLKSIADETKPAEERALGFARAARIDQIISSAGFLDDANRRRVYDRRADSLAKASSIAPPTSPLYVPLRIDRAFSFAQIEQMAEAEAILRETIEAAPLLWQPRLFLAELLSERGRSADALALVSADLQPSHELIGLAGYQFFFERRQVPLRRAFYRLQNLVNIPAEEREKEIAIAQSEYDLALADQKISEADPYALQIKAGMQELKQDRTGAVQTLTRALEASKNNDRQRLRIQQQLVSLNLALNQPGAASAMLEQMIRNPSLTPQTQLTSVIQLIDLRIRNGATEEARVLLNTAKSHPVLANNPALLALDIKLMTDPARRLEALAKMPEDNAPQRFFKLKFAGELGDEATVRRLATDVLKAEPGNLDVAMLYGDYLRRNDKRDEAIAVFKTAQALHPDNKQLDLLIRDTQAVTKEQREELLGGMLSDPYRRALYDAEQLRAASKIDEYLAKLLEAEKLDKAQDGVATERIALYYMAVGKADEAGAAIDRLASMKRDPAQIRVLRIRQVASANRMNEAATQAQALTAELPGFAPGWVVKGQVHLAADQPAQAIDAFETALTQQPDNVDALRGLVSAGDRANRRDVLKRYIDTGLRVAKNDDFFNDWSLRYELTYGNPESTIEPRLKRRDANPEDGATWLALSQAYLASSNQKRAVGDTAAADNYRNKALEVFTQAAAKFPKASGFTLEAASLIASAGDPERGIKMVDAMADTGELSPDTQAMRARFYVQQGRPAQAIALLQQLVQAGKASEPMRMQLAMLQANNGDTDGGLKTLEGLTDTAQVREARLNIMLAKNDMPGAQKLVTEALAKERSLPNLLMAALVDGRQNRLPDALKLAEEAVRVDPENAAARFTRVRILLAERPLRNNDIVTDLQIVRKNNPANVEARLLLVERLRALSRGVEATQELEALQRDMPQDLRAISLLVQAYMNEVPPRYARIEQLLLDSKKVAGQGDPELLGLEAAVALQRGEKPRAVAAARAAAKAAPDNVGIFRKMLNVMLRADAAQEAIAEVDRIQKDNTSLYWTYLTRGAALHRLKRDSEAAAEFDRAIGLAQAMKEAPAAVLEVANVYSEEYGAEAAATWVESKLPDEVSTRVLQMRLLTNGGKTDKAIAVGEKVVANLNELPKPAQVEVLATMGNAYLQASPPKADNARTIFARLNELEPDNMMTLNNLAYSMTLSGTGPSMQEAVGYAKRAYDLANQNASPNAYITDTYGWTLVQAGRVDEGLTVLREAFESGTLPESEYHIGEVYILQGQKDAALQTLKSALAKVNAAKQNGQPVDGTLAPHIEDAIRRAQAITTP